MSCRYLVENRYEYAVENMNKHDRPYVEGMREVISGVQLSNFLEYLRDNKDYPESMKQMYMDIAEDVLDHLSFYFEGVIAQMQVHMIDAQANEGDSDVMDG